MKISVALMSVFLLSVYLSVSANPIPMQELIKSKKISCCIHGNSTSTHYLEPVVAIFTNLSDESVSFVIDNGDMFIPSDSAYQNIVATRQETVELKPKEKKVIKIKGMCTEQSDMSGNDNISYSFKPSGNENLRKLAAYIGENKYQTSAAQYAVWSLMNNNDINSIYSSDSTEETNLKKFMASLTGKTYKVKTNDYRYNYYSPPREKVGGNFEYNFSRPQDVQIAMFDKNGILVRELFNQKKVAPGEHQLNFEFDSSVSTDDVYFFKLIAMNEVLVSQKWDIQAIRDSFKQKVQERISGDH